MKHSSVLPARAVIGMIHVGALPGTPRAKEPIAALIDRACAEAAVYREAGLDAVAIENMHDVPYIRGANGPEITAAMAVIGREVKRAAALPCGIQILAGANREALAAALAADLDFIRAEGFVFAHVADEGIIEAGAAELLRYRRHIGAEHVRVFTDVKKKHSSHAITADVDIAETAHAAEFFLSDGVIVTGIATGEAADLEEVRRVKQAVRIPVLVGSGITPRNIADYLAIADGVIVGSSLKTDGHWANPVDPSRVRALMDAARGH